MLSGGFQTVYKNWNRSAIASRLTPWVNMQLVPSIFSCSKIWQRYDGEDVWSRMFGKHSAELTRS